MDNELLLFDRLEAIKSTINRYGIDNFYISFSGGKDSMVLHKLIDMATHDDRFVIIKPSKPIRETLETYGYPFKSKEHAKKVDQWQRHHVMTKYLVAYLQDDGSKYTCPALLRYQFTDNCSLKISHHCCDQLKKRPAKEYAKAAKKRVSITGIRKEEGGEREHLKGCAVFKHGKLQKFHPLLPVPDEWEEWFIEKEKIQLCELYYEPYNFQRTGCKGCPFALGLQDQLEIMERYMPAERKQCEYIWKPVYDEYRRLGYRLKKDEQTKLF